MAADNDIGERLARLEKEMGALRERTSSSIAIDRELLRTSRQFVTEPTVDSARTFLNELDRTSVAGTRLRLGIWTVTITVVTIISDDHGD